jgi:hypothetical protein
MTNSSNLGERWQPAKWELADASALQALMRGDAGPEQQKRALRWVIEGAAGTYEEVMVPREPDTSAYLMGRRSVGLQIVKLLHVNVPAVKTATDSIPAKKAKKP